MTPTEQDRLYRDLNAMKEAIEALRDLAKLNEERFECLANALKDIVADRNETP